MAATVMTVRGEVPVDQLGFTLPHEHVLIDLVQVFPANLLAFDFVLGDIDLAIDEVRRYVEAAVPWGHGRPALVDVTTDARMGRDPVGLRRVSEALDLHIVMGSGRYREPWYEPELGRIPTSELGDRFVTEIEQGVGDTGIRPGIIGELGADRDFLSPAEERVLRAGARAHRRTGLPITLHARFGKVGLRQLDVLEEEGVALGRVIVGHSDTDPDLEYHEALARRGAWVQFDTIRGRFPFTIERRVRYILEARRRGFLDRILLSHDVCAQSHLVAFGGSGYDYLPARFGDRLREADLAEDELRMLFIESPRRALGAGV
jgi:predicted metal-dependent phosphotriesterase family hydrolase